MQLMLVGGQDENWGTRGVQALTLMDQPPVPRYRGPSHAWGYVYTKTHRGPSPMCKVLSSELGR